MFMRYMEGIQKTMAQQELGKPACGIDYSAIDGQPSMLDFAHFKPYAFRADEYGPIGGRFHLHALIGNVNSMPRFCGARLGKQQWGIDCCGLHRWPCGYARIFSYDPALGARFYLSKYVTKALGDYAFFGLEPGEPIVSSHVKPNPMEETYGIYRSQGTAADSLREPRRDGRGRSRRNQPSHDPKQERLFVRR